MITQPSHAGTAALAFDSAWVEWRLNVPLEPQRLTIAEMAECTCPDLCDRDHPNE